MLYKSLRKDCVRINGRHVRDGACRLSEGDTLQLYLKEEFFEAAEPETAFMHIKPRVDIVYEDENILLANKPKGMLVHAGDGGETDTLIEHIKAYLWQRGEYDPTAEKTFAPALCNRLDRNTSGIVIAAKNAEALRIMNEKIKNREIEKIYLCILAASPKKKQATLTGYLFKDERKKRVYVSQTPKKGTKTIVTRYKILAEREGMALAEVELLTGRTHQIRAQLAAIGCPLLGDGKYGDDRINKRAGVSGQALCAYKLKFAFTEPGGCLEYLNGREFVIDSSDFDIMCKPPSVSR